MPEQFRGAELMYELWAIGQYREVIERQIPALQRNAELRIAGRQLSDQETPTTDRSQEIELRATVYDVLPRYYRGPFIMTLWSILESAMHEVAQHIALKKGVSLHLRDIRGSRLADRWQKYFTYVLKWDLGIDANATAQLNQIEDLRDAFAHANGQVDMLREGLRQRIEGYARNDSGIKIGHGILLLSSDYLETALGAVDRVLRPIVTRASMEE